MTFERKNKYLVLKQDDIRGYLSERQKLALDDISDTIGCCRKQLHKEPNAYVVVNEDEPYAEVVWKLIELSQTNPEGLKRLLANMEVEWAAYGLDS